jgi:hypothetical protein
MKDLRIINFASAKHDDAPECQNYSEEHYIVYMNFQMNQISEQSQRAEPSAKPNKFLS